MSSDGSAPRRRRRRRSSSSSPRSRSPQRRRRRRSRSDSLHSRHRHRSEPTSRTKQVRIGVRHANSLGAEGVSDLKEVTVGYLRSSLGRWSRHIARIDPSPPLGSDDTGWSYFIATMDSGSDAQALLAWGCQKRRLGDGRQVKLSSWPLVDCGERPRCGSGGRADAATLVPVLSTQSVSLAAEYPSETVVAFDPVDSRRFEFPTEDLFKSEGAVNSIESKRRGEPALRAVCPWFRRQSRCRQSDACPYIHPRQDARRRRLPRVRPHLHYLPMPLCQHQPPQPPRHPCVTQFGSCNWKDGCRFANFHGHICAQWLKRGGECPRHRRSDQCKWTHTILGDDSAWADSDAESWGDVEGRPPMQGAPGTDEARRLRTAAASVAKHSPADELSDPSESSSEEDEAEPLAVAPQWSYRDTLLTRDVDAGAVAAGHRRMSRADFARMWCDIQGYAESDLRRDGASSFGAVRPLAATSTSPSSVCRRCWRRRLRHRRSTYARLVGTLTRLHGPAVRAERSCCCRVCRVDSEDVLQNTKNEI
eukprot:TRINITY_DN30357_c0_g1_i1.p1 TRINITY_DN30357_c0_g1~~TRINITY_DN30357_c0_g1_i1.p1  ORF type:complete len:533 (+),score=80.64 TRINITY_DN30357_c0_g1_i1:89-1687(+)